MQDVAYLANAVGNITDCHAAGQLHQGDGACFSPIPLCPKLPKISNGLLSPLRQGATEDLPGVVREYTCSTGFWVDGTKVTCLRSGAWDAKPPKCTACQDANCEQCPSKDVCTKCKKGYLVDPGTGAPKHKCVNEKDVSTIYVIGGYVSGSEPGMAKGHVNTWEKLVLKNGMYSWEEVTPALPFVNSKGSAAMIKDTVMMTGGYKQARHKLTIGQQGWRSMAPAPTNRGLLFYMYTATVGDRFYVFGKELAVPDTPYSGLTTLRAYSIAATDGASWRQEGGFGTYMFRGAAAAVGEYIYILGGVMVEKGAKVAKATRVVTRWAPQWQTAATADHPLHHTTPPPPRNDLCTDTNVVHPVH